jgi:hypothetical protein
MQGMSIWERAKVKVEELLGRAEQVYGESHGDAAAQVAGEAHVMEAEAEEEEAERRHNHKGTDDDGLAGTH